MSGLAQVIYVLLQHLAKHLKKKMKVKVLPAFFMMSHKRLEWVYTLEVAWISRNTFLEINVISED